MGLWRSFWRREADGFMSAIFRTRDAPLTEATTADLQWLAQRNELVYACISVKATAAQDPRLVVERRTREGEWEEEPDHPARRLLARPNASMTEADLMKAAIVSWEITSPRRFYAEKEYDGGRLVAIHPLNPLHMHEREQPDGSVVYQWTDGSRMVSFARDELLIREAPAWWAPSGLAAAHGSVLADQAQTDYVRAFFKNGGVPSGILKIRGHLDTAEADRHRALWRHRFNLGSPTAGDIAVLDENASYERIGAALDDLENEPLRMTTEARICMAFGVPPLIIYAYVGLMRATYSNLKEAWKAFWDATMSPAFKEWRDWWTWALLAEFEEADAIAGGQVRLRYDLSRVAALQADVDAIARRATLIYRGGLATRNEAREMVGLPPLDGAQGEMLVGVATTTTPPPETGAAS